MNNQTVSFGNVTKQVIDIKAVQESQTLGWQINKYKFPEIWSQTQGEGVKVAVVDTAVDLRHPDIDIKGGRDFVNNRTINYYKKAYPVEGHGTHVSGIISARDNDAGMVGVAPLCEVYNCSVLDDYGSGTYEDIIKAIDWCIKNEMDVINMSLGGGGDFKEFYDAIRRAYDANIPIVCAAGNSSWDTGYLDFPATYNETIAVASINKNMNRSSFSSIGSNIDVAAPGSNILSCTPKNNYEVYSGTSMAAPFVTGLIALMIAKHRATGGNTPVNTVEEIRQHIIKTTTDVDNIGQDNYTGYGLINPANAIGYETEENQADYINFKQLTDGSLKVMFDNNIRFKPNRKRKMKKTITAGVHNVQFRPRVVKKSVITKL